MTSPIDERPIGTLVNDAMDDVRAIIAHEKALAQAELKVAAVKGGAGAGLFAAALSLLSLLPVILVVTVAEGFVAAGLPRWGAYLLTAGIILVVALLLIGVGILLVRRIGGPKRAIAAARATASTTIAQLKTLGRPGSGAKAAAAAATSETVVVPPSRLDN